MLSVETLNLIVAFLALTTALSALFFNYQANVMQRQHNRLSVVPIPHIFVQNSVEGLAVILQNNGVGPLIIKDILLKTKNDRLHYFSDAIAGETDFYALDRRDKVINTAIPMSECVNLFTYSRSDSAFDGCVDKFRVSIMLLDVIATIKYTDIYGSNFDVKDIRLGSYV